MTNKMQLTDVNLLRNHFLNFVHTPPHFHYGDWENMCISGMEIDEVLSTAPITEAVEVIHGEWLDGYGVDHSGKITYISIDCSVCNDIFKVANHDREYWKQRFKICPFCGAIMGVESEE